MALRFGQALVHLTFNHVMTRLAFFFSGLFIFTLIWIRIALEFAAIA